METPQQYYLSHGPMTAHRADDAELRAMPRDLSALRDAVQGILLHSDIAPFLYDVKFPPDRYNDKNVRPLPQIIERIRAISGAPLTTAREPADRMGVVCRHFSLVFSAMLRDQGIPARARVGFGAYFTPGKFEDHWVAEYWNQHKSRWVLVDAQLDAVQRKALKIDFDPLDVPRNKFIIAGDAWQMCRSGRANPMDFGISYVPLHGLWFVAGNVVRDLASLNRMEMLPWDVWGLMSMNDEGLTPDKLELLDKIAALTLAGDEAFGEIRKLYESDDRLRVPATVFNADRQAMESIA
jgi:hypothetical protein